MRLEAGRVDHHRLRNGRFGSQPASSWQTVFCRSTASSDCRGSSRGAGPYSAGASRHRNLLRSTKIMPPGTRGSSTRILPWLLGKKGERRAICASVSQNRLLIRRGSTDLPNHVKKAQSISPDPGLKWPWPSPNRTRTAFPLQPSPAGNRRAEAEDCARLDIGLIH